MRAFVPGTLLVKVRPSQPVSGAPKSAVTSTTAYRRTRTVPVAVPAGSKVIVYCPDADNCVGSIKPCPTFVSTYVHASCVVAGNGPASVATSPQQPPQKPLGLVKCTDTRCPAIPSKVSVAVSPACVIATSTAGPST